MTKAVQSGFPKAEIEKVATARQTHIDSGEQVIVGVNKFKPETATNVDVLEIDNKAVREAQISQLNDIKSQRDNEKVQQTLEALTKAASSGEGNLLALSVDGNACKSHCW